jgi:hypothetical protein
VQVNLYQCECWCVGDTAYFTVPFAQRVTVGIQAFAKAFMVPLLFLIFIPIIISNNIYLFLKTLFYYFCYMIIHFFN